MNEYQRRLAELRERVAGINDKYLRGPAAAPQQEAPSAARAQAALEQWLAGEVVDTPGGRHFETETLYARHRRHGSADIGALGELPCDLPAAISGGAAPAPCTEWAFLDTETTGLAGGTGTCAFLAGVGRITPEGLRVRQFFMRDYDEEASALYALARHLERFRVLITYNGKIFDQPLLETRYRMNRARPPFARLEHLDLLHGARRLWKLRYESCRLVDLERQVLGYEREGDVPGALIPYLYFEYLRTRRAARLLPVFQHNALDILTLACLTAIVSRAFRPEEDAAAPPARHGAEWLGLARWTLETGGAARARVLLQRAVDAGLPDDLLFRALWDLAALDRRLGDIERALAVWTDLAAARNPYRARALEELAKHYEHRGGDPARALEVTRAAREIEDSPALRHREQRLLRRLAGRRSYSTFREATCDSLSVRA
jgi:hypothetical protein